MRNDDARLTLASGRKVRGVQRYREIGAIAHGRWHVCAIETSIRSRRERAAVVGRPGPVVNRDTLRAARGTGLIRRLEEDDGPNSGRDETDREQDEDRRGRYPIAPEDRRESVALPRTREGPQ